MPLTPPTDFGPYRILELIELTGGTHIFLARQTSVDRIVTLTVLPPQNATKAAFIKRFQRQVLAASRLSHPNVVRAIDAGSIDGFQYIAAEHAGGQRLEMALEQGEWFPTRRCVAIGLDIARALVHLESKAIVHRGLNPRAIVLAESGVAKLRSFSLSKLVEVDGSQTWFDVDRYAARYMAPELVRFTEDVDARADLYALGCVLYHVIAGRPPFDGSTSAEIMKQHAQQEVSDPRAERPDLPAGLVKIVLRCLEKEREKRYPDARALVSRLEAVEAAVARRKRTSSTSRLGWLTSIFHDD
jgi:serine/threonine-protein kinase